MGHRQSTVSLFSGAMGFDLGLERAGFKILTAVESKRIVADTIAVNRPNIEVFDRPVEDVSAHELLEAARYGVGELELISAGPCCQAFSTAGKRQSMAVPRGNLFRHFLDIVSETKPRFFVMENVRGLLSAAEQHRPLAERGPGHPLLKPAERYGSAFATVLEELRGTGYSIFFDLLNAADFGVPQRRERLFIIGSRDGQRVNLPTPTHDRNGGSGRKPRWRTLRCALEGLKDPEPAYTNFAPGKMKFVKLVPEGGNWRDLPESMWSEALGGAAVSWGGRTGFFRRLSWDEPTPALTTRPDSKATMFAHPDLDRPLSVAEYARIQQFPDDWVIKGTISQQYEQIGNAVPVGLAAAVGRSIRTAGQRATNRYEPGVVYCANDQLIHRIREGRGSVLNPERMRAVHGLTAAREWMKGVHVLRAAVADGIVRLK